MDNMTLIFYLVDHLGVAVFAVAGTLLAFRKHMDGFGVVVLASVTAIGGGTTRDLILDVPVFWLADPSYLYTILIAAILTIVWLRFRAYIHTTTLLTADAIGVAFFTVMGAEKALNSGAPPIIAVVMGTMTACFGGMLRDVLAREVPLVLKSELYATTCIIGAGVFVILQPLGGWYALLAGFSATLLIRLGAIRYHWSLPVFRENAKEGGDA